MHSRDGEGGGDEGEGGMRGRGREGNKCMCEGKGGGEEREGGEQV